MTAALPLKDGLLTRNNAIGNTRDSRKDAKAARCHFDPFGRFSG